MYWINFSFIKKIFIKMPIVGDFKWDCVDVESALLSLVGNRRVWCFFFSFLFFFFCIL